MAKRLKLILLAMLLCLSFSFAFAGVASAKTDTASHTNTMLGASINNVPSKVPADPFSGCRTWLVKGKNWFLPSGDFVLIDFDNFGVVATATPDGSGHFSVTLTACGFGTGKHYVQASDFFNTEAATDKVVFI